MELADLINELHHMVDYDKYKSCAGITPGATDCPSCCGKQYFGGNQPRYDCEQKRRVYVVRYLPAYIYENYQGFRLLPKNLITQNFSKNKISVLSLGGGPGSDMAGMKKYLAYLDNYDCPCQDFSMVRVDKEDGWDELSKKVNNLYSGGRNFNHWKIKLDVCEISQTLSKHKSDFVLISYLLSEITTSSQLDRFAQNLASCLTRDSIIIINDRDQEEVNHRIGALAEKVKLSQKRCGYITGHCGFTFESDIWSKAGQNVNVSSRIHIFKLCNDN